MNNIEKAFDPSDHLLNLGTDKKPRWYLEAKWRIRWFRDVCPGGTIETEILQLDLDREVSAEVSEWDDVQRKNVKVTKHSKGLCIFKATVTDGKGAKATGTKMENAAAFGDFLEKGETGSIARALAALGYGTQFTDDLEEGERIVDAPVERKAPSYDPDKPATESQFATIAKLQRELGDTVTNLDGLSFGDCASMLKTLQERLQVKRKAS